MAGVGRGFLALYQGLRGPVGLCATLVLDLPISAEYSVNGVVRQDFEWESLIWDERQSEPWKCYFSAVGGEVQESQQEAAQLRQQVEAGQSADRHAAPVDGSGTEAVHSDAYLMRDCACSRHAAGLDTHGLPVSIRLIVN